MTSESLNMKEEGKERIQNAIIGLVLLSASFLILNTINPQILSLNLEINPVNRQQDTNVVTETQVAEVEETTTTEGIEKTRQQGGITTEGTFNIEARNANVENVESQIKAERKAKMQECESNPNKKFVAEYSNVTKEGDLYIGTIRASCISK